MTAPRLSLLVLSKSTGGLAAYNKALLAALDPARFDSHTLCLSENGAAYAAELAALGLSAESLAMARYRMDPVGDLRLVRRVLGILHERRPDVLLAHGSKAGVIARVVGAVAGTPAVYRQASLPFLVRVQGRRAPLYWALETASRPLGGHMVALTEGARRITAHYRVFPAERIAVIRTGVDLVRFRRRGLRDAVAAELGLDPTRPIVGWLGRMEPQKAPMDFVDAVALLAQRYPRLQVMMAGDGRLREQVAASIAARGLANVITLLPWQGDAARTLEAVDIYALSSRWEGLPITLLEALASGCAAVATGVDGCLDAIEDGVSGVLVPAADPLAMAAAIGRLLDDPAQRELMGTAARTRAEALFATDCMVGAWDALLTRLAASAGRLDQRQATA
jgi:glycosyltransferase involved in cell wall biosynthesis